MQMIPPGPLGIVDEHEYYRLFMNGAERQKAIKLLRKVKMCSKFHDSEHALAHSLMETLAGR